MPAVSALVQTTNPGNPEQATADPCLDKLIPPANPASEWKNDPGQGAGRPPHETDVEDYKNDEQITEEAMLEIAIRMSLTDM